MSALIIVLCLSDSLQGDVGPPGAKGPKGLIGLPGIRGRGGQMGEWVRGRGSYDVTLHNNILLCMIYYSSDVIFL